MKISLIIKTRFFILSLLLLAFLPLLPKALGGQSDVIMGWGWSSILQDSTTNPPSGLGWISLNCVGDFDFDNKLDYRCNDSDYGLTVSLSGSGLLTDGSLIPSYIKGCAWSDSFGWICFDQDSDYCPTDPYQVGDDIALACGNLSDDGVSVLQKTVGTAVYYVLNPADPNTTATARASVLSLADADTGEVSKSYIGFPYSEADNIVATLSGDVTGCIGCPTTGSNKSCAACLLTNDSYSDPDKSPNPNILCVNCSKCTVKTRGGSCNVPGDITDPSSTVNTCLASSCSACYSKPGVLLNYPKTCQDSGAYCTVNTNCTNSTLGCNYVNSKAELCGWGYNAYDNGAVDSGLGWIAFNPALYGQASPYTQAEQGNVFSGQDISGRLEPPLSKYNAAYLIDAGGNISKWKSADSSLERQLIQGITFPALINERETASSSLATIDLKGLYTESSSGSGFNKYGSEIETGSSIDSIFGNPLANKVYFFAGNQTLNPAVTVANGYDTYSGAGIVYIKGNLTITKDISYPATSVTRLGYIPSLVWIVEGDVIIEPSVKKVVGTFIVLGDGNPTACPATSVADSGGCGRFSTGDDSANRLQLDIYGNVIARQILLQRSYSEGESAAERFIADGRLQTNTPAGLGDLGKNLPRFSSAF